MSCLKVYVGEEYFSVKPYKCKFHSLNVTTLGDTNLRIRRLCCLQAGMKGKGNVPDSYSCPLAN